MRTPSPGQVMAGVVNPNVIQSRRHYAPHEIIGANGYWIAAATIALLTGLGMVWAGVGFWFPLALAAMIFIAGGGIGGIGGTGGGIGGSHPSRPPSRVSTWERWGSRYCSSTATRSTRSVR